MNLRGNAYRKRVPKPEERQVIWEARRLRVKSNALQKNKMLKNGKAKGWYWSCPAWVAYVSSRELDQDVIQAQRDKTHRCRIRHADAMLRMVQI